MRRVEVPLLVGFAILGLAACAPEVVRYSAVLTPSSGEPGGTIEIMRDAKVEVGPMGPELVDRVEAEEEMRDLSFVANPLE